MSHVNAASVRHTPPDSLFAVTFKCQTSHSEFAWEDY
jgi:hypothetical protein